MSVQCPFDSRGENLTCGYTCVCVCVCVNDGECGVLNSCLSVRTSLSPKADLFGETLL